MTTYKSCGCQTYTGSPGNINLPVIDPCTDCLYNPSLIVKCADSVLPGANGTVDLTTETNAATFCESHSFYLLSYDTDAFSAVAVSVAGELTFTFKSTATPGTFPMVTFVVACDNTILSAQTKVAICVKDLCTGVFCEQGEVCDPLTGNCVPISDIEVS